MHSSEKIMTMTTSWKPPSLFPLLAPHCVLHEVITEWRPSNLTVWVRLLHHAGLLSRYSAGARTREVECKSNNLESLHHFLSTMAKNKRKRKLKEQDFQKVKLKVGKKLQPAQNATDTSFKSRSVFIPNQLQKLDNEPTNQRNQTLKVRLSNWYYSLLTFN